VPDAVRFESITFDDVLKANLKIMDAAAIALARDNDIPVVVFSIREHGNVAKALQGQGRFTTVSKT
jgi:uridylate kinase